MEACSGRLRSATFNSGADERLLSERRVVEPTPAPRDNIQERVRAASGLTIRVAVRRVLGSARARRDVQDRAQTRFPSHHNEHPQLPGQIEHGSKTMDFKGLFGVGGVTRKSRVWTSFEALVGGAPWELP